MIYTLVFPVFFQNEGEVFCDYLIPQMYSGITTHVLLPLTVKFDKIHHEINNGCNV
jgi:hypothetical protein